MNGEDWTFAKGSTIVPISFFDIPYPLSEILKTINERIELLIDRDHTIGHSYFVNINTPEKLANAFKGDLVFFGHSGNITHVGLVISDKGAPLSMIHASSSKGIMLTNIETSSYWKPKLKGVGKVI